MASTRIKWLDNRGANILRTSGPGDRNARLMRYEPPDGSVSIPEAAAILATNQQKLRRMASASLLKLRQVHGRPMIPLTEIRRLEADNHAMADRRRATEGVTA